MYFVSMFSQLFILITTGVDIYIWSVVYENVKLFVVTFY